MYPLGRRVEHDPRSYDYPVTFELPAVLKTVSHRSYGLPFDQGHLGSCTGNACAGALNTVPLHQAGERVLRETDAVDLYKLATKLDEFDGVYPPDDTGSSGLGVAKAAKQKGLISSYRHAFTLDQALAALQLRAVITGIDWYEKMFTPTKDGFIHIGGGLAGGHELCVKGYVAARRPYIVLWNSWGPKWGPLGGLCRMFVDEWAKLLDARGDVTVLL